MFKIGDKVCHEPYLGANDTVNIFGYVRCIADNGILIVDREDKEHFIEDKSTVFKIENFPPRCKIFKDTLVYEDGRCFSLSTMKPRHIRGEKSRGYFTNFSNSKPDNAVHTLSRVMYKLFIEDFDLSDKRVIVGFKDGNFKNLELSNLVKMTIEEHRQLIADKLYHSGEK
jgi:hypothetical protein